jgi:hypothetical protein
VTTPEHDAHLVATERAQRVLAGLEPPPVEFTELLGPVLALDTAS